MDKDNLHRLVQNEWIDDLTQIGKMCITIWTRPWKHVGILFPKSHQDLNHENRQYHIHSVGKKLWHKLNR